MQLNVEDNKSKLPSQLSDKYHMGTLSRIEVKATLQDYDEVQFWKLYMMEYNPQHKSGTEN